MSGLLQFFDANVAEGDVAVIALQKNWTRFVDFIVEFATGGFGAFDIVVNLYAIENERDLVSDDGCFGSLPLITRFGNELVRCFEVVDRPISINGCFAASIIAQDLNFVASAQVETAVRIIRDHVFKFDSEVQKFVVRDEIVSVKLFVRSVFQNAVFYAPTVATIGMAQVPACGVFAVEERTEALFAVGSGAEG